MRTTFVTLALMVSLLGLGAQEASDLTSLMNANVFEVVVKRPTADPMVYAEPLPLEEMGYAEKLQREYRTLGTAFAIGKGRFVTAAHVLQLDRPSLQTEYALRTAEGTLFPLGKLLAFSSWRDYAVFEVAGLSAPGLVASEQAALNTRVYTAGNALGSGLVLREGLLTSRSPEEWKGGWSYLRYSAPASPGNSGGPLLDDKGRLLGIVTKKSENENLNYALPWAEVNLDPVARHDNQYRYRLVLGSDSVLTENHREWPLPLSTEELRSRLTGLVGSGYRSAAERVSKLLLPGTGVIGQTQYASTLAFLEKKETGLWEMGIPKDPKSLRLGADGNLTTVDRYGDTLFGLTAPSNVSRADLASQPRLQMELYLQGSAMTRTVAGKAIRILSFGPPSQTKRFEDAFGRVWSLSRFDLPELNYSEYLLWLPTPRGGLGLVRGVDHSATLEYEVDYQAMADYAIVTYEGSLSDWSAFLELESWLPKSLRSWSLYWKPSQVFSLETGRVRWTLGSQTSVIQAKSVLAVMGGYFREAGSLTWAAGTIAFTGAGDYRDYLSINRSAAPAPEDSAQAMEDWKTLTTRTGGFDGVPYDTKERSVVRNLLSSLPSQPPYPQDLYWMSLLADGKKDHTTLRNRLKTTLAASVTRSTSVPLDSLAKRGGASLFDAILHNDPTLAQAFFTDRAAVSAVGPDGLTVLQTAIQAGRFELAEALLKAGASTDAPPGTEAPLLAALRSGRKELVGPLMGSATSIRPDVIRVAIASGWTDLVLELARDKALRDLVDSRGRTPLIRAIIEQNEALALGLLDQGALTATRDEEGWNALDHAIQIGLTPVANRLLAAHPSEARNATKEGWTAFHLAAVWMPELLPELLKGRSRDEVDRPAVDGTTPVMLAVLKNRDWRPFVDFGVDLHRANSQGWTVLALGVRHQVRGVEQTLPTSTRSPAVRAGGWNLIQLVARYSRMSLDDLTVGWAPTSVREAVQRAGPGGLTALHLAVVARNADAIRWLVQHGADLETRDARGLSPQMQAQAQGDGEWFAAVSSR